MQIDSVLPNRVSPGQSVIIQGEGLATSERVFLGGEEVAFEIDGEALVVPVTDGSGPVDVTVQGTDGANDTASVIIE